MTPQEAYKRFLLKVNKNDTNGNVKVPKGQFILLFNEQKRKWQEKTIRTNEDSDYIEGIEELLELDKELSKVAEHNNRDDFALPTNFYRRATSYSLASKDECSKQMLINWFIKPKDRDVLLQNSDQSPSFEYRETLAIVNSGKLSVFKDGFTVDRVLLSYYREPIDMDIEGYNHVDGTVSTNIQTDLSDMNIEEVLDLTATEAIRNYESTQQLQIALQRQQDK
jgi:hypothetical protein